jgi:uncharacterized OB-fold protein
MTESASAYPQPRADADNGPFLDAWQARGALVLQACAACGAIIYYPRPLCPACWSDRLEWCEVEGRGTVVSFALVHRPNHSSFFDEVPIVLAEIALAAGPRMLGRIVGAPAKAVRSGAAVVTLDPGDARRYPLPTFRLADPAA